MDRRYEGLSELRSVCAHDFGSEQKIVRDCSASACDELRWSRLVADMAASVAQEAQRHTRRTCPVSRGQRRRE